MSQMPASPILAYQEALQLMQRGQFTAVQALVTELLVQHPQELAFHLLLLQSYLLAQQPQQAWRHFQQQISGRFAPCATLSYWQGMLQEALGNPTEAVSCFQEALQWDPQHSDSLLQLARQLQQAAVGNPKSAALTKAIALYRQVLALQPQAWDASFELAELLLKTHQQAAALPLLLQLSLKFPQQTALLKQCLETALQVEAAPIDWLVEHFQHSQLWNPSLFETFSDCCLLAGRLDLARGSLAKIIELFQPVDGWYYQLMEVLLLFPIAESTTQICNWEALAQQALQTTLASAHSPPTPLTPQSLQKYLKPWQTLALAPYWNLNPLPLRRSYAQIFQRLLARLPARGHAHPKALQSGPEPKTQAQPAGPPAKRPRLGVVLNSNGATRYFLVPLLQHWPAELTQVLLFYTAPAEALPQLQTARPDFQHLLLPEAPLKALEMIEAQACDLLFLSEVHTDRSLQSLLANCRLAPVQFSSWLSSGTSGTHTLDYFLSSSLLEPPEAQPHYSEKLLLLADIPAVLPLPPSELPALQRCDFGLPEEGTLYLCPHLLLKLHPDFDQILLELLKHDPQAQLVLQARPADPVLLERFQWRLEQKSDPSLLKRVHWVPGLASERYLSLLKLADLILDPFYFGGGTTSAEALGLGVPVVTWPGERLHGRITFAFLKKMGVFDTVADSPEAYLQLALRLGQDRDFNQAVRLKLQQQRHRLFEQTQTAREIAEWLVSLVPAHPS